MKILQNKKLIIVLLLVLVFALYSFLFNMKPTTVDATNLIPFSTDGFTDSEELNDDDKLVASNTQFELYFDETTSYFEVVDLRNGAVWQSNPTVDDPWDTYDIKSITNSAIDKQKSTLEISYFNKAGSKTTINNYQYSIYHPKTILDSAGKRTFSVKYLDNAVQVLYVIEDLEIDYLYFPKFLPKDVFEKMEDRDALETLAYTGYDEELELYEIVQYEDMSRLVKKRLYKVFYEDVVNEEDKYTRERAISENATYGYTETYEKVRFEIGVEIRLTDTGVKASIINESIVEPENVKLSTISFLPLFGTAISRDYETIDPITTIDGVDVDYLHFPKYIDKDEFEAIDEAHRTVLETIAYIDYDAELEAYEFRTYEDMSLIVAERLYEIFYGDDGLNYTRKQAITENERFGYSVLTEGYIVLPDGSGAIMELNNGKFYQEPYVKRLYGEDLALLPYKLQEEQQQINFPIYGLVKEDIGYAAIITAGDTMATIKADVSDRIDSYNKVFPSFNLREVESVTLGSGFNQYGVDLWTTHHVKTDFTIDITFLEGDDANYVGIAAVYKDYLINELGAVASDTTSETILTTEFIGAYDRKEFFLGVPYYSVDSLTSFDQALEIIEELRNRDIEQLNVLYTGMINGGISSSINTRFKVEKELGGKRDYYNMLDELDDLNITMYPRVKLMTTSDYNKMFDHFRYTASRIDGDLSRDFVYHLPSKLPASETPYQTNEDDYVINPEFYQTIFNKFDKSYDEDNIAFDMLGSTLAGHYPKRNALYKQVALEYQRQLLSTMEHNTMLVNPLGFAVPYADYIVDLPTETTLYAILDYQIPLVHLVLSGLVDYSITSINTASERGFDYNFLKVIETGSNLKYTLSYDDSKELRNTAYNYYISTSYLNWMEHIEKSVKEINTLGIHEGTLVGHERLQNNVYKVTYSHGLEIIINYNLSDVTIDGELVESLGYYVVEVE